MPYRSPIRKSFSLGELTPVEAVGLALLIGFIVFSILDIVGAAIAKPPLPIDLRLSYFLRGFLAFAGGMLLVWASMTKKERELVALRDRFAEELEKARVELKEGLQKERDDFLAIIKHRLHTPILASERIVSLFLQGDFGELEPGQKEIMVHLADNNRELDRLLSMLIDLYRYKNGTKFLEMADHDLAMVIEDSITPIAELARNRHVTINSALGEGLVCHCDVSELQKMFSHLIENAVKHAKGHVTIDANQVDGHVECSITDDGSGIAPEDIGALFDRFYVGSASGKYSPATGTGLCLCSEIAKAHGGKIRCESELGHGAKFVMSLPAGARPQRG